VRLDLFNIVVKLPVVWCQYSGDISPRQMAIADEGRRHLKQVMVVASAVFLVVFCSSDSISGSLKL